MLIVDFEPEVCAGQHFSLAQISVPERSMDSEMRIQIREKDGVHFTLLFPTAVVTGLLGSRLAAKLIIKALEQNRKEAVMQIQSALTPQTIRRIQKELKKCIRQNRRLTLVEVESSDGDYVKIVL